MNTRTQKWIFGFVALLLIGAAAGFLSQLSAHQKLGAPGIKTLPLGDGHGLAAAVDLPETVLDYKSEVVETAKIVLDTLPKDTSYGQRMYQAPDKFAVQLNVVLMGADRTSLHKPQFCLRGSGWSIDKAEPAVVPMTRPQPYELPVMKLSVSREKPATPNDPHGVFVYWFVADNEYTAEHWQRMWWMARDLFQTGVLQRWAYVICFAQCGPGQENAAFERIQKFIAAAAPEFQLTPKPAPAAMSAR